MKNDTHLEEHVKWSPPQVTNPQMMQIFFFPAMSTMMFLPSHGYNVQFVPMILAPSLQLSCTVVLCGVEASQSYSCCQSCQLCVTQPPDTDSAGAESSFLEICKYL